MIQISILFLIFVSSTQKQIVKKT